MRHRREHCKKTLGHRRVFPAANTRITIPSILPRRAPPGYSLGSTDSRWAGPFLGRRKLAGVAGNLAPVTGKEAA